MVIADKNHVGMAVETTRSRGLLGYIPSFLWGGNRGYDATQGSNKRRSVSTIVESTDSMLGESGRKWAVSETRDLYRNFSLAAWAIRKHLDYTTGFVFHSADERLRQLMATWSEPLNCDVRGQHSLAQIVRMAEERRTVDGDAFLVKLSGGMLQAIEGDRIKNPAQPDTGEHWVNGVRLSKGGRPRAYGLWDRRNSGYQYARNISARNAFQLSYCDRFDQVRGVSPLMSSANTLRDLYESQTYELAKGKVLSALGLVIERESQDPLTPEEDECPDTYEDRGFGAENAFGKAPWLLETDPGDKASFLTAQTPSNEWQNFAAEMTRLCLGALDIPYSFFNGKGFNFSQSKADWLHYSRAVENKQRSLVWLLDSITKWKVYQWAIDGEISIETAESLTWEWSPQGAPWWNPVDEVQAAVMEIQAGLSTRNDYTMRYHGKRFVDVVGELEREEAMLEAADIPVVRSTRFYNPDEAATEPPAEDNEEPDDADEDA